MGASGPVVGSLWAELYGTEYMGAIRSMVTASTVFSTALSPIIFVLLIDGGGSVQQLLYCICDLFMVTMEQWVIWLL